MEISKYQSKLLATILLGFCFSSILLGQTKLSYFPEDKWRISTPEEQGINSDKILEIFREIRSSKLDFHSILIIRNGYIITEAYWSPYNKNTMHNIKSVSKSLLSALVGIALDKKYLNNIDQRVTEFYSEYTKDTLKSTISLRDLLTMKGGFDWTEDAGPSPFDLVNWNIIPIRDKPGDIFEYNTMLTHMMSAILTKASGVSTKEFAEKWLFDPMGIKEYQWTKSEDGIYHGGSDIFLTPRDMAKFGYLFLSDGIWNGKQIVPKDWINESTTIKTKIPAEDLYAKGLSYGYWWWIGDNGYMAWGAGGQYIIVKPDFNLVIVVTANSFDKINRYEEFMKSFLNEYIYSAVESQTPIAANRSSFQELKNTIHKLEKPEAVSHILMPEIAAKISNIDYILEPNEIGLKSINLIFRNNKTCTWTYSLGDKKITMHVGLNGNYINNKIDFSMGVKPDGEDIACKGSWKNEKIFFIEHHIIGDPSKQFFEFIFDEKNLKMNVTNLGMNMVIKGTIKQ